jgi:hypothetical protein
MSFTEIQIPEKAVFYSKIQNVASSMNQLMHEWSDISEFIANVDEATLTKMAITDTDVIADLTAFRTALNVIVSVYEGDAVSPIVSPSSVIDKLRRM